MSYFKVCPYCGSHLDHGEACDCKVKTCCISMFCKGVKDGA